MRISKMLPAMFAALALVSTSIDALSADIVNGQLRACVAEKKAVGDVNSCGKKWKIGSSQVHVMEDGAVNIEVKGLVLDDMSVGDANGTPDGVDAIAIAVLCGGKMIAQADPVTLNKQGDATFAGKLSVPKDCASPVVVVRERYEGKIGGWLAATGQ